MLTAEHNVSVCRERVNPNLLQSNTNLKLHSRTRVEKIRFRSVGTVQPLWVEKILLTVAVRGKRNVISNVRVKPEQ